MHFIYEIASGAGASSRNKKNTRLLRAYVSESNSLCLCACLFPSIDVSGLLLCVCVCAINYCSISNPINGTPFLLLMLMRCSGYDGGRRGYSIHSEDNFFS